MSFLQQVATPWIDDHLIPPEGFEMVSKYSGTISSKMEQSFWQKVARIDKLRQSNQELRAVKTCGKSNWRLEAWLSPRCFICQRFAGFIINVRRFAVRVLDHTRLFPFRGCARSKPQFLTAVPSLKLFRLTQVYVWMGCQLYNFGRVCWKHYPVHHARETWSVTHAREFV